MYKFYINDKFELELEADALEQDIVEYEKGRFHIMLNQRSHHAELIDHDSATKTLTIKVNNNLYTVKAEDRFDRLLKQLGFSNANTQKAAHIKAPMPGLVLKISVEVGQEVSKGDTLLILEAMKMENVVKAPNDGKIKLIKVKAGDALNKGQVMVEFE